METFTHLHQRTCGSPELDQAGQIITAAIVSPDALPVRLTVKSLVRGHVHGLHLPGVPDRTSQPLPHDPVYHKFNQIPGSLILARNRLATLSQHLPHHPERVAP